METDFTPGLSSFGGILIGLAAVLLMASIGRIAGATGILTGLFAPSSTADWTWRATMLAGMVTAPSAVLLFTGEMPTITVPVSMWSLAVGGFIVGVGVVLGSGCTSGHGVCGLARLSPRSLVTTVTFMITTAVTVFLIRHVIGT
jgi:uncharacterized membrane protein YedE/YeeE